MQDAFIMIYFCSNMGNKSYIMELGGNSDTGCWGYIEAFQEMIKQVCNAYALHCGIL